MHGFFIYKIVRYVVLTLLYTQVFIRISIPQPAIDDSIVIKMYFPYHFRGTLIALYFVFLPDIFSRSYKKIPAHCCIPL